MSGRPATGPAADLLGRVLSDDPPPFALLHRPAANGPDVLDIIVGGIGTHTTLADLPLPPATAPPPAAAGSTQSQVLTLVPYRQIGERGFACVDDGTPLLAMTVESHTTASVAEVTAAIPDLPVRITDGHFDVDDDTYAATVRRVIDDEIGEGTGANFVIRRSYVARIPDYSPLSALVVFRRLLRREAGAYWTFVVHTGERTLVGATPERHITLRDGMAVMNPISGTYRYPQSGPDLPGLMDFISDRKETEELYMVLDEELKMMARLCERGGWVTGPHLREMTRLAHTEYFIQGATGRDVREILHETMFAPTVTGSPLESACRVISAYEPQGRGYYSGVVALIGRDRHGAQTLDSSILIRTADIDRAGTVRIGTGATLVRHSSPTEEVAETRAKAAGLIGALTGDHGGFRDHPEVCSALERRNHVLADFWLRTDTQRARSDRELGGRRVLIVDAEDSFTSMLGRQLQSLGLSVTVRRFDEPYTLDGHDLVVMGPGPGDPLATDHRKITYLNTAVADLLAERRPFLAVCLSHQVLSLRLGFDVRRRGTPNQGTQRAIDLFGRGRHVGFYNTFAAYSAEDKVECPGVGVVEVSRDRSTGEVHALRGGHFASLQFHAESVLTRDGEEILADIVRELMRV
ncbi:MULTISPECIES: phenazine-specific anthranilate synthase component I [Streptomyces]|uniref:anthranilate synthase n=2 Tax=Streptomyces chartreusis TaxID=1969 RepID=A0A2N9BJI2_STRCX|nr:phenazine-specific anthranilate synthase component I [Streptomyces chartreusis]MYS91673.1 phenazine-specific anthranilate synthase component I [Streptomyces sp. SID5464]SOR83537.1 Anthranilate synthase component 1 [Streptomyces chartreusis NRRL 3882]